jgi:multicomponent K+:H+ antiporter subunit C
MEALVAVAVGTLIGSGVYLLLRARTFPVVLGLTLVSYGVNIFLFASGRVTPKVAPLITEGGSNYADPLPQALVLTAIVIGFGMTAFLMALALRGRGDLGSDHVDGKD